MLSSDKNVAVVARLIEVLKHYLGLQAEYLKLDTIDKVVRLLTAAALAFMFLLFIIAVALMFSLAIAFWIGHYIGMAPAFLIIGLIHLAVLLLFIIFRKPWIERPLVRFLAGLLMHK